MIPNDAVLDHLRATLGFQYEIGRELGRGGMGTVYFARERALDREVAIKVLPPVVATDDARGRFLREARTAALLTHPNIVPLHTFGDTGTVLYYVMGFVDGESLGARLAREARISPDETQRILEEVAGALAYAHEKGVVHRDIKPDNILIERGSGRALLTDFGIAKRVAAAGDALTQTGVIVGTPRFMSPEQAAGDREIDGRSDIYSLGVVAYTMVAGRSPFDGPGLREILAQQMTQQPVPLRSFAPDVPMALVATIDKCMKKAPAARWPDASSLLENLRGEEPSNEGVAVMLARGGGWIVTYGLSALALADVALWARWHSDPMLMKGLLWYSVLGLPFGMATDVWRMRRRGASRGELRRLIVNPPTWWPFWWMARFRSADDVWQRLPRPVRVVRILRSIGFASFFTGMELTLLLWSLPSLPPGTHGRESFGLTIVGFFAAGLFALVTSAVRQYLWGRANGLSMYESDRVAATPTTKLSFWKRSQVARLLGAAPASLPPRSAPEGAPELVAAIRRIAEELPSPMQDLGRDSVAAARQLADAIAQFDREIATLSHDVDPAERRRLEQRLEAFRGDDAPEQTQMRELYSQQLALFRRLGDRLDEVTLRRQQVLELLRVLWLQLAALRGQAAKETEDAEVTGRIRSVIADAERYSAGLTDVRDLSLRR